MTRAAVHWRLVTNGSRMAGTRKTVGELNNELNVFTLVNFGLMCISVPSVTKRTFGIASFLLSNTHKVLLKCLMFKYYHVLLRYTLYSKQWEVSDTEMAAGAPWVERVLIWRQKSFGKGARFSPPKMAGQFEWVPLRSIIAIASGFLYVKTVIWFHVY